MLRQPAIPSGLRIYAIGDVHGRLDLFAGLLSKIQLDAEVHRPARVKLVILGDFIDRGPSSAEMIFRLCRYTRLSKDLIVLRGNHEQMMLRALGGDVGALREWLRFGGDATLRSFGICDERIQGATEDLLDEILLVVPDEVVSWLASLPLCYRAGGFYFVHAGIRPGISLAEQVSDDLMWIGSEFIDANEDHPAIIVHGHSIAEHGPEMLRNRIGLDTGAYRTGRLSAAGFEGARQWCLVECAPGEANITATR